MPFRTSKKLLYVIWKPTNTFRDQKIRPYVEVKNKIWKTWLLFHFVQIDWKWQEEITQEDGYSWFEENGKKYWNFLKFQKFSGGPLYLFSSFISISYWAKKLRPSYKKLTRIINPHRQIFGKWARPY